MYQNVLTSSNIKVSKLEKTYLEAIVNLGNKIVEKYRYGSDSKVNYILALKLKNLLPVIRNINDINYLYRYFNTRDIKQVINKLNSLVKS